MKNSLWMIGGFGLLVLSACGGGGYDYYPIGPVGPTANVQFIHASPDAPELAVLIDGQMAVPSLYFGQGTGESPVSAGSHTVTIQALNPAGPTTVVGPTTINFEQGNDYAIEAEGDVASISAQVYPHVLEVISPTATRVQFVHAAPGAPSVSVYVTAPGAALAAGTAFGTTAFMNSLGPTSVTAGQYEIRLTPAGQVSPVLYDSGTITFNGGDDLVISALQNTGPGTASVTLGVVDAVGDSYRFYDVSTPSEIRVVHDSPNAPALSVIANGNTASPLVSTLSYETYTAYSPLSAGTYSIGITPAGNPSDVLVSQSLTLDAGNYQTVYALGTLPNLTPLVTVDYRRRVATEAKLRIIQGSPSSGTVDVYLTAPGAGIASATPLFPELPFGGDTGFQGVAAGSYDLTITVSGSQTALVGPTAITVENSGIYTAAARDAPGGGAPYGLILLDDFVAVPLP